MLNTQRKRPKLWLLYTFWNISPNMIDFVGIPYTHSGFLCAIVFVLLSAAIRSITVIIFSNWRKQTKLCAETLSMKIITFCGRVKMVYGEGYVMDAINAREIQFCEIDARLSDVALGDVKPGSRPTKHIHRVSVATLTVYLPIIDIVGSDLICK